MQNELRACKDGTFVTHIRSHTTFPGFTSKGNECVGHLVSFVSAEDEHNTFHTNVSRIQRQYKILYQQAKLFALSSYFYSIISHCPICKLMHILMVPEGVNPWGMQVNEIWQVDVIRVPEFGRYSYVLVSIDTFSTFVWGTPLNREAANHVI